MAVMNHGMNRRQLLGRSAAVLAATATANASALSQPASAPALSEPAPRRFKLGLVTYNLAKDWDLPTIIRNCTDLGLAAVELRTSHKHGVEPTMTVDQRKEVRKRFADSPVVLWGLGSTCQYHEADPAAVSRNVETTKRFAQLAHDVGARGVKVRPNGFPKGIDHERTIEQIGRALRTCGEASARLGVEIWVEAHGAETCSPANMRKIMEAADHPNVGVTWNSNYPCDLVDGSIRPGFDCLAQYVRSVHINELVNPYPYRDLFTLLRMHDYTRYTLIEAQALNGADQEDALRFIRYYIALWNALSSA